MQRLGCFDSFIIYSRRNTEDDVDWEGMVTNIKNFMRDQSEMIKDHCVQQTNKIEQFLKGENDTVRDIQDKLKKDIRDKNTQVKDDIGEKVETCQK